MHGQYTNRAGRRGRARRRAGSWSRRGAGTEGGPGQYLPRLPLPV